MRLRVGDVVRTRYGRDLLTVRRLTDCELHGIDVDCVDDDLKLHTIAIDDLRRPVSVLKTREAKHPDSGKDGRSGGNNGKAHRLPPPTTDASSGGDE